MGNSLLQSALLLVSLVLIGSLDAQNDFLEPCNSTIYCYGPLIDTIQRSKLYEDDKSYVDFALRYAPAEVFNKFTQLNIIGDVRNDTVKVEALRKFIKENFDDNENGTEFENWVPGDWNPNPQFLTTISDPLLKEWATTLHEFWEELGRKIKPEVRDNPDRYSMHYVSHPVIVPGGRFKEFYYWDSYWIQKGLIVSEMTETVRGMIENFFEMVELLSYIPNGGRIYYQRSQPPLLLPMVKNYYDATKNVTFIKNNIATMEKEFDFFMTERTVNFTRNGKPYTMARYDVKRGGPRPESYEKDYHLVENLDISPEDKEILYSNLKAGAESGWDFSSRWFVLDGTEVDPKGNLSHVKTRDIIPVDLNGFLYWNAVILDEFCELIKNDTACSHPPTYYSEKALQWKTAIHEVLWDEETGSWYDYDYIRENLRKAYYTTNITPLWVNAHHDDSAVTKHLQYVKDSKAIYFAAGIPSSMESTGEQWDFPNGWAPLNHMFVEAFEYSGNKEAQDLAFDIAQRWTRTNYKAYVKYEYMFEKYDVTCPGCAGGGGEYEIVVGFGWTNGVILDFLKMYGDRITSDVCQGGSNGSSNVRIGYATVIISILSIVRLIFGN